MCLFKMRSHYVDWAGLEFTIVLSQPQGVGNSGMYVHQNTWLQALLIGNLI